MILLNAVPLGCFFESARFLTLTIWLGRALLGAGDVSLPSYTVVDFRSGKKAVEFLSR